MNEIKTERPLIEKEYVVKLKNGKLNKVNIFDMNLALCCDKGIVQLADGSWNFAKNLEIIGREL